MQKKIVFLADCLITQKAGIHFYAKQLINRIIVQYPHNQYFILLPSPFKKINVQEIIVPIETKTPFHFRLRSFIDIPKTLNKIEPDIVIELAHFGPFRLKKSIQRITVIHDITPILYPQWHSIRSYLMHSILLPSIIRKAEFIICNSEKTKHDLRNKFKLKSKKVNVAYPSISQTIVSKKIENPILQKKYFLSVGTIEPRKNYGLLFEAWKSFHKSHPDYHLIIAGYKGWKSDKLYETIKNSKCNIKLEGYASDDRLNELYIHSYALIFPSLYEGFGLPVLEAMTLGIPIIASEIPTNREICKDAALYFDPYSSQELINRLKEIVDDLSLHNNLVTKSKLRAEIFNRLPLKLDNIFT